MSSVSVLFFFHCSKHACCLFAAHNGNLGVRPHEEQSWAVGGSDGTCTVCGAGTQEVFKYETAGSKIEKDTVIYSGTAFSVKLLGGGANPTKTTGTAQDGTKFDACLLPEGSGRSYQITAKQSGTIYLYITVTDGSFSSKTATVTYGSNSTSITSQKGVAYKLEMTVVAGETYTVSASADRLALFGVIFE